MATGGIFQILTNQGRQDKLLMANDMLRARLKRVAFARASRCESPTPTLVDIEKTHVLFMNAHFKPFCAIGFEYHKTKIQNGTPVLGSTVQFNIPQFGDFFHDMSLRVVLTDPVPTGGNLTRATYRWCDYPGERLLKRVSFNVNGNPLDSYTREDVVIRRKLWLTKDKEAGYRRCVGQEEMCWAEAFQSSSVDATGSRLWFGFSDDWQTPKPADTPHGQLEMNIPLHFWFNERPSLAVPSVAIPYGQRYIDFELATQTELVGMEQRGDDTGVTATIGTVTVRQCELYMNNIFVNPEIHDIFIRRIGFNLIRVHRSQAIRLNKASDEVLLNQIRWPIEWLAIAFQPTKNTNTSFVDYAGAAGTATDRVNHLDHWDTLTRVQRDEVSSNPITVFADRISHTIATMGVRAHGIDLYRDDTPASFYSDYLPTRRGGTGKGAACDHVYFVPFCLYPGAYQPSGHINVSRSREFYIVYDSSSLTTPISDTEQINMLVSGQALNFLLVSDGSAALRYST